MVGNLIIPWIKAVVGFPRSELFTPSGIPSDDQIRNALKFDGKRFVFNPEDIMVRMSVTVCFTGSKNFNFYTTHYNLVNPTPEVSLGPALDLIRMDASFLRIDFDQEGVSDKDIKRIFDAIHVTDEKYATIIAGSSGLTSLKNFQLDGGELKVYDNNLKSFAGAGRVKCNKLNAMRNRELTSVAGLGSRELKIVNLTGCTSLKSLKGLPPLEEWGMIEFTFNPELSIADGGFRDLIKGKTNLYAIKTDAHIFNDIDNKDVWGDVRVDDFHVYINERVPLPDNFPDLIPQCKNLILNGRYAESAIIRRQINAFELNGLKPYVKYKRESNIFYT